MIRRSAIQENVPFLNIVQACTWAPQSMRVPNPDEVRYLVHTTLAYGAQGLSYYIFSCANHLGGFALPDGTPTPLYHAAKDFNRDFVAISQQLQPLRSLGVYHTHLRERGCEPLPANAPFHVAPGIAPDSNRGFLIGTFGPRTQPTHAMVVNLDYRAPVPARIQGPARLSIFDASAGTWTKTDARNLTLTLPPGGGRLVRTSR